MKKYLGSPYLLLTLATLFWAGNTVVGKAANPLIPAFSLSFWRWIVAFCFILPFGIPAVYRDRAFYRMKWRWLMVLAFMSVTTYNTFLYWALNWTSAINVSVVSATLPVVIFFVGWLIGGLKVRANQFIGALLAISGVLMIISKGDLRIFINMDLNYGDILILISVICLGVYSVLYKKLQANVNQVGLITVFIFFGLIGIAPFYVWDIYQKHFFLVDTKMLSIFLYVGLFPSLLSFFFWNKAIESGGAQVAGMFFNLLPVFSSVLAVIFLKEIFAFYHFIGMVLIFIGIYFSTFYQHNRRLCDQGKMVIPSDHEDLAALRKESGEDTA